MSQQENSVSSSTCTQGDSQGTVGVTGGWRARARATERQAAHGPPSLSALQDRSILPEVRLARSTAITRACWLPWPHKARATGPRGNGMVPGWRLCLIPGSCLRRWPIWAPTSAGGRPCDGGGSSFTGFHPMGPLRLPSGPDSGATRRGHDGRVRDDATIFIIIIMTSCTTAKVTCASCTEVETIRDVYSCTKRLESSPRRTHMHQ